MKQFFVIILLTCEYSVMWVSILLESRFMIFKIKIKEGRKWLYNRSIKGRS